MRTIAVLILLLLSALTLSACGALSGLSGETSAFDLEVGTCFNDAETDAEEVASVADVACSEPHDNEVFYLVDYNEEGDFPGEDALAEFADTECQAAFEDYVGIDYASSRLYVQYLYPTQGSWDNGDREIACVLYDGEGEQLTGSMRDSAE